MKDAGNAAHASVSAVPASGTMLARRGKGRWRRRRQRTERVRDGLRGMWCRATELTLETIEARNQEARQLLNNARVRSSTVPWQGKHLRDLTRRARREDARGQPLSRRFGRKLLHLHTLLLVGQAREEQNARDAMAAYRHPEQSTELGGREIDRIVARGRRSIDRCLPHGQTLIVWTRGPAVLKRRKAAEGVTPNAHDGRHSADDGLRLVEAHDHAVVGDEPCASAT